MAPAALAVLAVEETVELDRVHLVLAAQLTPAEAAVVDAETVNTPAVQAAQVT
jgi:hypothetical protein